MSKDLYTTSVPKRGQNTSAAFHNHLARVRFHLRELDRISQLPLMAGSGRAQRAEVFLSEVGPLAAAAYLDVCRGGIPAGRNAA
jgi:hypothetical protein